MGTITVPAGSELGGTPIGELGVTVAAITQRDGPPEPIPSRERVLDDGDVVYAIATPEALRRVEAAANRQRPPTADDADGGDDIDDASEGDDEPTDGENTGATDEESRS